MHGTGALYTRIAPPGNFGKPAGEWQTLDVRLVGMVTGTLNGHKLYEKGVIDALTGIAFERSNRREIMGRYNSGIWC